MIRIPTYLFCFLFSFEIAFSQGWEIDKEFQGVPLIGYPWGGGRHEIFVLDEDEILIRGNFGTSYSPEYLYINGYDTSGTQGIAMLNSNNIPNKAFSFQTTSMHLQYYSITRLSKVESDLYHLKGSNAFAMTPEYMFFDNNGTEIFPFDIDSSKTIHDIVKTPGNEYLLLSSRTFSPQEQQVLYYNKHKERQHKIDLDSERGWPVKIFSDVNDESGYVFQHKRSHEGDILSLSKIGLSGSIENIITFPANGFIYVKQFKNGNMASITIYGATIFDSQGNILSSLDTADLANQGESETIIKSFVSWEEDTIGIIVEHSSSKGEFCVVSNHGAVQQSYPLQFTGSFPDQFEVLNGYLYAVVYGGIAKFNPIALGSSKIGSELLAVTYSSLGKINHVDHQSDGTLVVSGEFDTYNGHRSLNIVEIDNEGSILKTYPEGIATKKEILKTRTLANGNKYIHSDNSIYELAPNRQYAKIILGGGISTPTNSNANVLAFDITPSGNLVVVSMFWRTEFGSNESINGSIKLFDLSGKLISSIVPEIKSYQPNYVLVRPVTFYYTTYAEVTMSKDGSALITGSFKIPDSEQIPKFIRLTNDTKLDDTFTRNIYTWGEAIGDLEPIDGNSFFALRKAIPPYSSKSEQQGVLIKFSGDGSIDDSFKPLMVNSIYMGRSFGLRDGRIISRIGSELLLFNENGSIDTSLQAALGENFYFGADSRFLAEDASSSLYFFSSSGWNEDISQGLIKLIPSESSTGNFYHPKDHDLDSGNALFLNADLGLNHPDAKYQWLKNGSPLEGMNSRTLSIPFVHESDAGSYTLQASLQGYSTQSNPATVSITPPMSKIRNYSVRGLIADSTTPLLSGFVTTDHSSARFLIRAAGPSLSNLSSEELLDDPALNIFSNGQLIATVAGVHSTDSLLDLEQQLGAFPFNEGTEESASIAELGNGIHGFQVFSPTLETGYSLLEAYDVSDSLAEIAFRNTSVRGSLNGDNANLMLGFVIEGDRRATPKEMLIRGIGPGLLKQGVEDAIENPILELIDASSGEVVASNQNWEDLGGYELELAAAHIGAFPLAKDSRDSAFLVALGPGVYGALLTDADGDEGEALIELYDLE